MRTYRINPKITVKFKGHDTQVYNYPDMEFVPFSLASQHADNPYIHNVSGNGNLKFQGRPGANNTANIVFQGFSAGAFPEIDQWAFMQPVALNTISPDTGLNIKGVTDDLPSYSYTYTEPGITRPKVFASPPFSKKGGLFHNIRLHFCVFSSNFGGET